ncbi:MAG TPA: hypothetical protein VFD60_04080 [Nitrososphaeraceae archaeon]|nr:hypothetical protein [Nitrososphaeraceae archaeon]
MSKSFDHEQGATIHNVRLDTHFTITANTTPADPNLSWAAKGLLWYILSRPKDWCIYSKQLSKIYLGKEKGNGRDAVAGILKELREAGYINYRKHKDEKGRWRHRYDVYPMPIKDFQKMIPQPGYPGLDDPGLDDPGILPNTDLPNTDRNKKEIKESKTPIVHNFPSPKALDNSIVPPSASAAQGSIPFQRKDKEIDLSSPELLKILEMEPKYISLFRPDIVMRWVKKFGPKYVLDTIGFFFEVMKSQKKNIPNPEAWMESALKKNYVETDFMCQKNKEFAQNLKKKHSIGSLKINKRYCQDTDTGKDYYYNLPHQTFKTSLMDLYGIY